MNFDWQEIREIIDFLEGRDKWFLKCMFYNLALEAHQPTAPPLYFINNCAIIQIMKVDILGVKIDDLKKEHVLEKIGHFLNSDKQHYIVTPYSEFIVRAQKNIEFKSILNLADLSVPDGTGILWAGKVLSTKEESVLKILRELVYIGLLIIFSPKRFKKETVFSEKISGVDLIWDIARIGEELDKPVFLLGGWGGTPGKVAVELKVKYPDLNIVGAYAGSPDVSEEPDIIKMINKARPSILLVAFGPERQEKWIASNLIKLPSVKLTIGLGGTFDYLTKKRRLAPKWMRKRGLEWLFRLFTQPWRIGRMIKAVPVFAWLVFAEKLKAKKEKQEDLK